jgi:hypothetical protein
MSVSRIPHCNALQNAGRSLVRDPYFSSETAAGSPPVFNIDELTAFPWVGLYLRDEFMRHQRQE